MFGRDVTLAVCSLVLVAAASVPAWAAITPVNTGPAPETGIHMGGFMLYPELTVGGQYNDNVFAVNTGAQSDVSLDVHPSLRLDSTWSHLLISLKAQYDMTRYNKLSQQDTDDYLGRFETKFDLDADTQLDATTEFGHFSELPGNTNITANAAQPTEYNRWNSTIGIKHVFNRLQIDVGGDFTTLRYSNTPAVGGGFIFSSDRNRDVADAYADLGYSFGRGTQVFTRATWNQRDYSLLVSKFRNSSGFEVVGGIRLELTNLISGQAYVGYLQQDYKTLSSIGGFDYGAQFDWFVTRLTTVSIDVHRSIEETDQVGGVGYFATGASLSVMHQLTRSVTLEANVEYTNNDYRGVSRNEDIVSASVGAKYHFMPQLTLGLDYTHSTRDSNVPGTNYSQNRVELGLKLAL